MAKTSKKNRKQIQFITTGAFLVTGLLLVLTCHLLFQQYLHNTTSQLGQLMARQLAYSATRSVIHQDKLAMQVLLSSLVEHSNIPYAAIEDTEGNQLAVATTDKSKPKNTWPETHSAIISISESIAGKAVLSIDLSKQAKDINYLSSIMAFVVCMMSAILWFTLPRFIEPDQGKKTIIMTSKDAPSEVTLPVYNTQQIAASRQPITTQQTSRDAFVNASYIGIILVYLENLHQATEDLSGKALQQFLNDFKSAVNSTISNTSFTLNKEWFDEDILLLKTPLQKKSEYPELIALTQQLHQAIQNKNILRKEQGKLILKTQTGTTSAKKTASLQADEDSAIEELKNQMRKEQQYISIVVSDKLKNETTT